MKVRCIRDCFYKGQLFETNDQKYHGVYTISELKPGEKLPSHLAPIVDLKKPVSEVYETEAVEPVKKKRGKGSDALS